jgi:hypothetical protein
MFLNIVLEAPVYVIFGKTQTEVKEEEKFTFSFAAVLSIPALILISVLNSLLNRQYRLLISSPLHIIFMYTVLPLGIVFSNQKMKRSMVRKVSQLFEKHPLPSPSFFGSNKVYPKDLK